MSLSTWYSYVRCIFNLPQGVCGIQMELLFRAPFREFKITNLDALAVNIPFDSKLNHQSKLKRSFYKYQHLFILRFFRQGPNCTECHHGHPRTAVCLVWFCNNRTGFLFKNVTFSSLGPLPV